jgi:hypothetical protein
MSFAVALESLNVTLPGHEFQPLLPSTSGFSIDDIISKMSSDEEDDASDKLVDIGNGAADLLGQLVSGSRPSAWDLANTFLPALLGLVDPFLGAATGFITSFLGALFNGGHSPSLWEQIEPQVKALVSDEILQSKVNSVKGEIEGLLSTLNDAQAIANDDPTSYVHHLLNYDDWCGINSQHVFDACYKSLDDVDCIKWEKQGIIQYQIFFANIHLHTKVALINQTNNSDEIQTLSNQFWDHWHTYVRLLDHSFSTFQAYRLGEAIQTGLACHPGIYNPGGRMGTWPGYCSLDSYHGDLLQTSKGVPKDFIADCGVTMSQSSTYSGIPITVIDQCQANPIWDKPSCPIVDNCVSKYKNALAAELAKVSKQIESIKAMMGSDKTCANCMCRKKLHDMYEKYLGRAEDAGGMEQKMSRCVTGETSQEQFIGEFTTSEEYCRRMLHGLYEQYLCRAEDKSGMQDKMSRCMAGATTRDQFIAEFMDSEEYKHVRHPCPKSVAAVVV